MRQIFANLLATPFLAGAFLFLYLAWTKDSYLAPWMIPFVVAVALIYIFAPQINWWWYSRNPPNLPAPLRDLLERYCGFYRRLDVTSQQKFRNRCALFMMATDWTPMAWPEDVLPPDVQLALAAQAVTLSFHRDDFLFEKFEKVIVYPIPFPSPEYDFVHASELYEEDACLLFSAQHVVKAFIESGQLYNIGLHEYAKAFVLIHPKEAYPDFTAEDAWDQLQTISRMSREHVESVIGLAGVDALPVAIHHYFIFPEQFRRVLPEKAALFDQVFKAPPILRPEAVGQIDKT